MIIGPVPASVSTKAPLPLLAVVLGLLSGWTVLASAARPAVPTIGPGSATVDQMLSAQYSALMSAQLGVIRGDLWADAAVTAAADLWDMSNGSKRSNQIARTGKIRQAAERAVSLAPHDARAWLLLALLEMGSPDRNNAIVAALKMSYYTGPNETSLRPVRLELATRLPSLADQELRILVEHELRAMATGRTSMRSAIEIAYRNGSAAGRRLIDLSLETINPVLRDAIRTDARKP